jgi:predicted RNA-binding Zn-ribbon protein involved in translation (DUF1610 family)
LELYKAGYNIVPIGSDKRPLTSWSSTRRIELEELKRVLSKATGIAIVGGPENPWKPVADLILIDIDDPRVLDESPRLKELVESTTCWRTGPRCPECYNKHLEVLEPGRRFRCPGCGSEFRVDKAARGLGALLVIDIDVSRRLLGGSVRLGPVELLLKNYQLIPPSLHPTGVKYEWVRELDLSLPNHSIRSVEEFELRELLEELESKLEEALEALEETLQEHLWVLRGHT